MNIELSKSIISATRMDFNDRQKLARKRLKDLVAFAKMSSPFYRDLYQNIDPENFTLTDLPIIDKNTIKVHFDQMLTDSTLDSADIRKFAKDSNNSGIKYRNSFSVITTSGTNGNPLIMIRDASHDNVHALLLKERLFHNIDPECLTPVKSRIAAVLAGKSMCSSYSSLMKTKQIFPDYAHNIKVFDITGSLEEIIAELNEFQPNVLSGYPSIISILMENQQSGRLAISPNFIVCSAETLTDATFRKIKETFPHVVILNNYCSTEGGEIAMSCPQGHLHLNDDWIILEGVDANNQPVPAGTISEKVFVTDLSNYVLPILRYCLDDKVCFSQEPCSCGMTLPVITIKGREADTLTFHGISLPSVYFMTMMYEQCDILSWQFAQTSENTLEFRAVYAESSREKMKNWTQKRCSQFLEEHHCSDIQFIISNDPPKNSKQGGKLKSVVKEC